MSAIKVKMHWPTLSNIVAGALLLGQGIASVIEAPDTLPRQGRAYNGVLDAGDLSNFTLSRRQGSSPQCGSTANGARCTNNLCCSQWGYCGSSDLYCSNISGCQPAYGACEGTSTTTTSSATTTTSTTTSSSSTSTVTTTTSTSSTSTSSTSSSSSSSSSSTASPTVVLPPGQSTTTDGTCGNNKSCLGWAYGQCCSQYGFCGSSDTYCSAIAGCQVDYGLCEGSSTTTPGVPTSTTTSTSSSATSTSSATTTTTTSGTTTSSTSSSSSASPTVVLPPGQSTTTDGTCGNNKSCLGWANGQCCSQYGYCGSSDVYCSPIAQCQPTYGICDPA